MNQQTKKRSAKRAPARRVLRIERLENRNLLAGDFWHNDRLPDDVNGDQQVWPVDALSVINYLNRERPTSLAAGEETRATHLFLDVNDDAQVSASDPHRERRRRVEGGQHHEAAETESAAVLPGAFERRP